MKRYGRALAPLLLIAAAPAPWQPAGISSERFESHPAFDPITGDFWFVRSAPDFSGWRLMVSHCGEKGWSTPEDAPIAGDGVEADPLFTDGGRTLWFISTRTTDGITRGDLDIWRVARGADNVWGKPERLPEPINSSAQEWFPQFGPDGWLYFGSARPGGEGKTDIWRARQSADGKWVAENAGPAINGAGDDYEPLISPDGQRMLIAANDGYYESRWTKDGWSQRVKLGSEINVNGSEIGALFSPSGKSWLFARDAKDGRSGEFMVAGESEAAWPPDCPKR